jgi:hypothetical protein
VEQPPFEEISSERVEVSRSAVAAISAENVDVQMSAVQSVMAGQARLQQSLVGTAQGENVSVRGGLLVGAVGKDISVENTRVLFLLSPSVSGNVRAVFTLPTALALGVGFFLGRRLARAVSRRLGG